jgi:transcriptional regulator with XRE-family HTH domain
MDLMDFHWTGLALRRWRSLHRIKQAHAAELFGVAQSTVSRWEAGSIAPAPDQYEKLRSILSARLEAAADRELATLVSESPRPIHLICSTTHTLLAASALRKSEFGQEDLTGRSLWPFATQEIAAAECTMRDDRRTCVEFETGANGSRAVPIRPSRCRWTRMMLSDGSVARLVETLAS